VRHVVVIVIVIASLDEGWWTSLSWLLCVVGGVIQKSVIFIYPFHTMGFKQFAMNAHHGSMVR
jgi:hypothetical protein